MFAAKIKTKISFLLFGKSVAVWIFLMFVLVLLGKNTDIIKTEKAYALTSCSRCSATAKYTWVNFQSLTSACLSPAPNTTVTRNCDCSCKNGTDDGTCTQCRPVNGACGSSNGWSFSTAPNSNLCSAGTASAVAGSWSWSCSGTNGGTTANCSASKPATVVSCNRCSTGYKYTRVAFQSTDTTCAAVVPSSNPVTYSKDCNCTVGTANYSTFTQECTPIIGRCGANPTYGTVSSYCFTGTNSALAKNTATKQWNWTCSGVNGGANSGICSISYTDGACGTNNLKVYSASTSGWGADINNFCSQGSASPAPGSIAFPAQGGNTSWSCLGANGGNSASCSASRSLPPPVNGQCGTASGKQYPVISAGYGTDTFCAINGGTPSPANPAFPALGQTVNWSCLGSNGGTNTSCSASRASPIINGACGTANKTYGVASLSYGTDTFCSSGTPTPFVSNFPAIWQTVAWTCQGINGGTSASCAAFRSTNGACGTANGQIYPALSLGYGTDTFCSVGIPSPLNPAFPAIGGSTSWQCKGINNGTDANCSASRALSIINGACGTANTTYGVLKLSYGTDTFCSSGIPSPLNPNFPAIWQTVTWACKGINGGADASCAAIRSTDGACGTANGKVYPALSLGYGTDTFCSSGIPSPLNPPFPWLWQNSTWICKGINNGTDSATCSASRLPADVNGACGTAAKSYSPTDTVWPSGATFCASGTALPVSPGFPWIWQTVTWVCQGGGNGTDANCSASRNSSPAKPTFICPATAAPNQQISFSAVSTDPDGDKIRYTADWDNNGTIDEGFPWGATVVWLDSGTPQAITHTWTTAWTYNFAIAAKDNQTPNGVSPSVLCTIDIGYPKAIIDLPIAAQSITTGWALKFSGHAENLKSAQITADAYEWRDGNCTTGTLLSSQSAFVPSFSATQTLFFRIAIKNPLNGALIWSTNCPSRKITVQAIPDLCPTVGAPNQPITFSARTIDPDGDNIRYTTDWDNNGTMEEGFPTPYTGNAAKDYVPSGTTQNITHTWTKVGKYPFNVGAKDIGQAPSIATVPCTIEISLPVAVIDQPVAAPFAPSTQVLYFEGHGEDIKKTKITPSAYEWRADNCTTGTLLASTAFFSKTFEANTTVYFRVKDPYGNWSNCVSKTVTIQAADVCPTTALKNQQVSFTVKAVDPENEQLKYTADWDYNLTTDTIQEFPAVPSGTAQTLTKSWTITGTTGKFIFAIGAKDVTGNSSELAKCTITIGLPQAVIDQPSGDQQITVWQSLTFNGHATDLSGKPITAKAYQWLDSATPQTDCSKATVISTAQSFSKALSKGTHYIYLRVQDNYGTTGDWSTNCPYRLITFKNSAPTAPEVAGSKILALNQEGNWSAKSTDPDGDYLHYIVSGSNGPNGTYPANYIAPDTYANFTYKWATAGTYTFNTSAQDNPTTGTSLISSATPFTVKVEEAGTPIDGKCGAENGKNYTDCKVTTWETLNFCEAGKTPSPAPTFPTKGTATKWTCKGIDGGHDSQTCSAQNTAWPVTEQCGSYAAAYSYETTDWPASNGEFCKFGNLDPASPLPTFPQPWAKTYWNCKDFCDGGTVSCSATRSGAPAWGIGLSFNPPEKSSYWYNTVVNLILTVTNYTANADLQTAKYGTKIWSNASCNTTNISFLNSDQAQTTIWLSTNGKNYVCLSWTNTVWTNNSQQAQYWIDTTPPTCSNQWITLPTDQYVVNWKTWIKEPAKVTADCQDSLSGCQTASPMTGSVYDHQTAYIFHPLDNAGNQGSCESQKANIDKNPPACTIINPADKDAWIDLPQTFDLKCEDKTTDTSGAVGCKEEDVDEDDDGLADTKTITVPGGTAQADFNQYLYVMDQVEQKGYCFSDNFRIHDIEIRGMKKPSESGSSDAKAREEFNLQMRKNIASLTRGLTNSACNASITTASFNQLNNTLAYFSCNTGENVTIDSALTIKGQKTLIVTGGNLRIKGDITYDANDKNSILGIIVLDGGEVLIDKGVKNISAVLFTEGTLLSADASNSWKTVFDNGEGEEANRNEALKNQLYWKGSVITYNTVGGHKNGTDDQRCPYGSGNTGDNKPIDQTNWKPLCQSSGFKFGTMEADLKYLRSFYPGICGSTDINCQYRSKNSQGSIDTPAKVSDYPAVLEYDSRILQMPPPGFQVFGGVNYQETVK